MIDGEKQLIHSAINGEASAFGLLYDRYQPQIYRFIYLKVSHREEAEDLCHQVFLNAWQNISGYRYQGFPFSAWLYAIARNKIIDYYRNKKVLISIESIQISIEDTKKQADEIFDNEIDLENVKQALLKLPQMEQDVIIMRFVEELSLKDIAKILNKNEISIRVTQSRAIKKIKKIINYKL